MGNESRILLQVSGRLVMLRVGESPGMEGNEEEGMHDQTHGIIELLGLRKGAMAALVCQNPDTGEDETLDGGVCNPGCESKVDIGQERNVGNGEVDQGGEVEVIANDVCH